MNKAGSDPKVKKTFIRNCELKVNTTNRKHVVREVDSSPHAQESESSVKGAVLSEPTVCSSAALANYLSEMKTLGPPPLANDDLNVDKGELCAKMTKKLNFHVNDRIYRNLVELNSTMEELKTKKDKKPVKSSGPAKRDLEPNIEDFCEDEKELDVPPKIPVIKPKTRLVKTVEDGKLHRLVASFEIL